MISIGNVCKCGHGKLGVVTKIIESHKIDKIDYTYQGIGFDGKSWTSVKPVKISSSIEEYIKSI